MLDRVLGYGPMFIGGPLHGSSAASAVGWIHEHKTDLGLGHIYRTRAIVHPGEPTLYRATQYDYYKRINFPLDADGSTYMTQVHYVHQSMRPETASGLI